MSKDQGLEDIGQSMKDVGLDKFRRRRAFIERYFLNNNPKQHIIEVGEKSKGKVLVLTNWLEIPDELKSEQSRDKQNGTHTISIYFPGMFQTDKSNTGNNASELKLIGSMGGAVVLMAKGEGLTSSAYLREDGSGACQERVTEAVWREVKAQIDAYAQQHMIDPKDIRLKICGYSEGSTQAASLAARAFQDKKYTVESVVSVGGAGLVGFADQKKVDILKFFGIARQGHAHPFRPGTKLIEVEGPDTMFIANEILRTNNAERKAGLKIDEKNKTTIFREQGLHGATDQYESDPPQIQADFFDDAKNILRWFARLVIPEAINPNNVPKERVDATCTLNPDIDILAEHGVPFTVFSMNSDEVFSNEAIRKRIETLRQRYGKARIGLISTDAGHTDPHYFPSAIGTLIEIVQDRFNAYWDNRDSSSPTTV